MLLARLALVPLVMSGVLALPFSALAATPTYKPMRLFYYTDNELAKKSFMKNAWPVDIFSPPPN